MQVMMILKYSFKKYTKIKFLWTITTIPFTIIVFKINKINRQLEAINHPQLIIKIKAHLYLEYLVFQIIRITIALTTIHYEFE